MHYNQSFQFGLRFSFPKKQLDDTLQDAHNDTTKQIHYDSYVYIHSPHKDNIKGEAELRGTDPKRLEKPDSWSNCKACS